MEVADIISSALRLCLFMNIFEGYTATMIERYVNDDALNAREDVLLVPMPIGETDVPGGFAGEILRRFPIASIRLSEHGGLQPAEVRMVGSLGREQPWFPAYSLALTGLHRQQRQGWARTPEYLQESLDTIRKYRTPGRSGAPTLATAGIPGTGFSGLRGDASPEQIKRTLDEHGLLVIVYQDNLAGDRAVLDQADPLSSEVVEIQ